MISSSSAAIQNTDNLLHMEHMQLKTSPPSSSRILDIPCKVCGDFSSGKHYNIFACDGCAGFFKRSIRRNRQYVCKAKSEGSCIIDKSRRNQCRACRLSKCQEEGMNKDAVQHERGPRNSTLRRQHMAHFFDSRDRMLLSPNGSALDLAIPKSSPPMLESMAMAPTNPFICNPAAMITRMPIQIPTPIMHPMLNPATICESAARLLFMNVTWTKNVPSFAALPMNDQLLLLEESWRELFILGASQFLPLELTSLVHACGVLKSQPERAVNFIKDVNDFQDTLSKIAQFHLDAHEYACLRAIVLFKTGFDKPTSSASSVSSTSSNDTKTLTDSNAVAVIQDNTQLTLNKYLATAYPGQPLRFGKLMMMLPTLRNVPCDVIEDLFFRKTIGHIPIVRIICDMYKSQTCKQEVM